MIKGCYKNTNLCSNDLVNSFKIIINLFRFKGNKTLVDKKEKKYF